ncbi:twin-arginine translocase TatA/TatE family subunit [Marine Group I thaumarchaeote]|uniref:Twin-arginine translocase TatA/TatE family subunit n=1 Tax=Marine Group I thaumarchaeote TaxID=2511932 RepID=A0A7K4MIG9_9ARCH|nr:twin-arginine translocase TatA/TatE family subunit [Candidatus Nitrosopumilus sp. MTA1]NWJ20675.1 twin-arginine translocase TatA/TatE family subunit [Marine Group I thaumarchaeote]NWJ28984.1 twin-arginine translocase TatA/TatE family subunit [Marine Group I thaumarchaeote]NWJ57498.1 twin-arginine translocase TatA/TatE family subunit [Marine Group I thaumarchaeote]NWJ84313.1 twin-arginine translocase TatA/TatE family subunit [Marine Group I thaumarchaeote]
MLGMNIVNFIQGPEIIILVVVIGVLIFGVKKIPELAKTFGKAKGEFEKGKIEADNELKDFKGEIDKITKDKEVKSD